MSELTGDVVAQGVGTIRAFYDAVNRADAAAIEALIDAAFGDDVVLVLPPSLPYGGRVEGKRRLRRMFGAMASGAVAVGPRAITVERVVADGDHAVAVLSFGWYPPGSDEPVTSGASELWTFSDEKVAEIRAYYWDTAALVAASA